MSISSRLQKLRQQLTEKELETILISQPDNRYYLSGFDGSSGYLLITPKNTMLATDFRYTEQARRQAPEFEIIRITNDFADWFLEMAAGFSLRAVGFEACHITFAQYRQLTDALYKVQSQIKFIPLDGLVESLRAIKESEEIDFISRAVDISDNAFEYIHRTISNGMSEKEIAWEIEKFMHDNGSDGIPFDIIVASGPNSALPHARPSQRTIKSGEPIIFDIGAKYGGYSSDLSRTICLGTPDDTFTRVYDTVLGAQLTALAIVKEGMTGDEIDKLARVVIEEAGYGEAFGHALGHGVGLAPHEQPRLGPKSSDRLVDGMVFTVEPGIYLAEWGGVRIEDIAVIEDGKARVISKARKV